MYSEDHTVLAKIQKLYYKLAVFVEGFCAGAGGHWVEDIEKHSLAWLSPIAINTILNVSYPSASAKITAEGNGQRWSSFQTQHVN